MSGTGIRAVIPMKPLDLCKLRLAPILDSPRRALLTLWMLDRVAEAARNAASLAGTLILGGDEPIRRFAQQKGVGWAPDSTGDLNRALDEFYEATCDGGWDGVLFLAGDLPELRADDVTGMLSALEGADLVLGPGARGGTNAILVRRDSRFAFHLGANSFRRHRELAESLGLKWRAHEAPGLHADIDLPSDLDWLERQRPELWREIIDGTTFQM